VKIVIRGLEIHVCVIQHFCVKFTTSKELSYKCKHDFMVMSMSYRDIVKKLPAPQSTLGNDF
jgi:hypothetical protein